MKKIISVLEAVLLMAALVLSINVKEVKAAGNVVIHVQNNIGWDSVNIYTWGDDGELADAWPGTAMDKEDNGWYTKTFEASSKMNLVFCVDADKDGTAEAQTGDLKDVDPAAGEIFITLDGGGDAENDLGAAVSGTVTLLEGKPDTYTTADEPKVDESTKESSEEVSTTAEETTKATVTDANETPKTGDSGITISLIIMMSLAAVFAVSRKSIKE